MESNEQFDFQLAVQLFTSIFYFHRKLALVLFIMSFAAKINFMHGDILTTYFENRVKICSY